MEAAADQPPTAKDFEKILNHHLDPIKHDIQAIMYLKDAVNPIKSEIDELTKRVGLLEANYSSRPASARSASGASVDTGTQAKLTELEREVAQLREQGSKSSDVGGKLTYNTSDKKGITAVVGNLDGFTSLEDASKWL